MAIPGAGAMSYRSASAKLRVGVGGDPIGHVEAEA
jgi:hypothetical protein